MPAAVRKQDRRERERQKYAKRRAPRDGGFEQGDQKARIHDDEKNNSGRPLFWREGPRQSREYVTGKPNHAFHKEELKPATAQSEFHPNGRRNHSYTPPENAAKKPAEAPDAWQQVCQLHLKEWVTPGQRAKLEAEYNAGIATGKSWREIGAALGQIVKGWKRGR
jgi:hypothetical protein